MNNRFKNTKKFMGAAMICFMAAAPISGNAAVAKGCIVGFAVPILGLLTFAIPACRP